MVAYMNREALDCTIKTGCGTYYSRSRKKLWKKGEQSGHVQKVSQILVDCDQDCIILKVTVDSGQCHVGYQSCFYRALKKGTTNTTSSNSSPKRSSTPTRFTRRSEQAKTGLRQINLFAVLK